MKVNLIKYKLTEQKRLEIGLKKIKEVRQNEKDVKVGIVAANNHYGGYGPGTVDIFRENMDMDNYYLLKTWILQK